jgi:phage replication O-like protein O
MADVQAENGYTRIANELLEALARIRINGEARQILDTIFRKTYGFNKTWDDISLSQFVLATDIQKSEVIRAINKLLLMNLIGKKANGILNSYCIIKDFEKWKPLAKKPTLAKKPIIVGRNANLPLAETPHTIDNITKDKRNVHFYEIWTKYPKRVGKKSALRHFNATVKNDVDWININKALENYLKSDTVKKGFIQNGSTWFNDWDCWLDQKPKTDPSIFE